MLTQFQVSGYKNLPDTPIELGRVTVLIGANNSGKTNLLRAMTLLEDAIVDPTAAFQAHGGLRVVPYAIASQARYMSHAVTLAKVCDRGSRHVEFRYDGRHDRWWLASDRLSINMPTADGGQTFEREVAAARPDDTPTLSTTNDAWPDDFMAAMGRRLFLCRLFRTATFDNDAARQMRPWAIRSELDLDGIELAALVKGIEQDVDDLARPERLWKMVAEAFQLPVARPLRVQDFGTTTNLQLELIRPGAAVPLADLSDGSIQMLRLACWASGQSRILIDEPELHLHPAWARLAARWILQSRAQFVLATHSPELLDGLTAGLADGTVRLVVLGVDGTVTQPSADLLAKRMENGWELGDLFRGGEPDLGGWPW